MTDFALSSNWKRSYVGSFRSSQIKEFNRFTTKVIPPIEIPTHFTAPYIVLFTSSTTKNEWYQAGWFDLLSPSGISGSKIPINSGLLRLNQPNLIQTRAFSDYFTVTCKIKWYIEQITLTAWEYIGAINEEIEDPIAGFL